MVIKKVFFPVIFFCVTTSVQSYRFEYNFTISTNQVVDIIPKSFTVQIINHEESKIKLNNLIFTFYVEDEGFWAISDSIRFLEKDLVLRPNQKFRKTVNFDSLTFTSFVSGKNILVNDIKNKIKNSKKLGVKASISDMRKLENPLESSSLSWSNFIELKRK